MSLKSMIKFIEESDFTNDEKMELLKNNLEQAEAQFLFYADQCDLLKEAIGKIREGDKDDN